MSKVVEEFKSARRYYLNFGNRYESVVMLWGNLSFDESPEADTRLYSVAGRIYPIMFTGENRGRRLSIQADLLSEEAGKKLRHFADTAKPAVLRTPDGGQYYVRATVRFSRSGGPLENVSVDMEVIGA